MKRLIKKAWIDTILDVSTAHISQQDSKLLMIDAECADKTDSLTVHEYEEGFFVYVSQEYEDDQTREDFSKEFKAIMAEARQLKCKWVCFDCDGVEYEGLPTFDW